MTEKITYIPGWLDRAEYNGMVYGVDVWGTQRKSKLETSERIIVAHSLGCHWAVKQWNENDQNCIILVNPLFPGRSWPGWIWRWIRFFLTEGAKHANPKRIFMFRYFPFAIYDSFKLLTDKSVEEKLMKIPAEKLVVIGGKDDKFFFDNEAIDFFKKIGAKVFIVEKMGHVFRLDAIKKELNEIISSLGNTGKGI